MNPYAVIAVLCGIVIISYIFLLISERFKIPSVILLIALGVGLQLGLDYLEIYLPDNILAVLNIVGNLGLVMIVLEASLDLHLSKKKGNLVLYSFLVAFLSLALSLAAISALIYFLSDQKPDIYDLVLNAIPLSIVSSAIVIPSVSVLKNKGVRESLVYESTFSDILGIMVFYFMINHENETSVLTISGDILRNLIVTIGVSILSGYALVYLFLKIKTEVKMFLVIAVLMLLYVLGKLMHLSSLLMILVFGLIINNSEVFFRGKLKVFNDIKRLLPILKDFKVITVETSFLIRSFFFVLFGFYINLGDLVDLRTGLIALLILASIYLFRFIITKPIYRKNIVPQLWIAPRGLITILLFFQIPEHLMVKELNSGVLLFVILLSSLVMAIALILHRGEKLKDNLLPFLDLNKKDE